MAQHIGRDAAQDQAGIGQAPHLGVADMAQDAPVKLCLDLFRPDLPDQPRQIRVAVKGIRPLGRENPPRQMGGQRIALRHGENPVGQVVGQGTDARHLFQNRPCRNRIQGAQGQGMARRRRFVHPPGDDHGKARVSRPQAFDQLQQAVDGAWSGGLRFLEGVDHQQDRLLAGDQCHDLSGDLGDCAPFDRPARHGFEHLH